MAGPTKEAAPAAGTPCGAAAPADDEKGYGPNLTKGLLKVPNDGVDVGRTGANPTADLVYSYQGWGY